MDLGAAAAVALCLWLLSACRPRVGLEAAVVPRNRGTGQARRGPTEAAIPLSPWPAEAAARVPRLVRNGSSPSVIPHPFMLALYRSLSARALAPGAAAASESAGGHQRGLADTVTGFTDQAPPDEASAETGQRFLFDVSSLADADEVVAAELRVLRRAPGGPRDQRRVRREEEAAAAAETAGQAAEPPFALLLLSTCPG
ncbi:growth/differentiation factor 7-like, partial [Gracilinanus agilis]|uniref:growth/differentiation factor 7-like n=1 Tax=Gracilinanus agilis TaxID=191870 RepID=UPI001CFEDFFC